VEKKVCGRLAARGHGTLNISMLDILIYSILLLLTFMNIILAIILVVSGVQISLGQLPFYQYNQFTELVSRLQMSNNSLYEVFNFGIDPANASMNTAVYNLTSNTFNDPTEALDTLGCSRRVHVNDYGIMYCVDVSTNYFYQISVEYPWVIAEEYWIGFPTASQFIDSFDSETNYVTFYICYIENSTQACNYTVFDLMTNQWVGNTMFNATNVAGPGYNSTSFFVGQNFIGFVLNAEVGSQIWIYNFTT
jgi:hypothetical protein